MSFAPEKPITGDSWPHQAMPAETRKLQLCKRFSPAEFERLGRGLLPAAMDDQWFAYLEDGWLNLHRSTSGVCVYKLRIVPRDGQWDVAECVVNDHRRQRRSLGDDYDVAFCEWLLDNMLLGRSTPKPRPPLKG